MTDSQISESDSSAESVAPVETLGPDVGPANTTPTEQRAREIVDAIERPRTGRKIPENALPALDLPGFGDPYDECGNEPVPRFCADCGHIIPFTRTCYRATCSNCAASWCRRQSTSIAAKLDALRRYRYSCTPPSVVPKFHHVIFSPPTEWFLLADALDRTFEVINDALDALGMHGAAVFYHPYRGKDGDDRGAWKERLFSGREWQTSPAGDGVDAELELSPHFHVVGVAREVDVGVTEQVHDATEWAIHRVTNDETGVSVKDDHDLARKVSYCLSHTGLYETDSGDTRAAYRYLSGAAEDVNDVTANDEAEDRMDAIMRSVVPETLGLNYNDLACGNERSEKAEHRVSTALASGSRMDSYASDPGDSDVLDGGSDEWDDVDLDRPDPVATAEVEEVGEQTIRCEGRLLNIMSAPSFLEDDEWREGAEYADELEQEYEEYVENGVG